MLTVLKSEDSHGWPKVTSFWNYTHFYKHEFEKEIKNTISAQKILWQNFEAFITIVTNSLNRYASLKN